MDEEFDGDGGGDWLRELKAGRFVGRAVEGLSSHGSPVILCGMRGLWLKSGGAGVRVRCESFGWYEEVESCSWEAVVLVGLVRRLHSLSTRSTLCALQRASLSRLVWGWVER